MATTLYLSPISLLVQLFSNIGIPLQGGFVNTYLAGTVGTAQTTYTDSTGSTPNANPIALSSAGRLVAASGAPVAVWVPSGTNTKMVITDSGGNFILSLDNIPAINDPTAVLSLLSSVSTSSVLGGADIVANAMRSYDVIASVRSANAPNLVTGQTLVIDVEGGSLIGDGAGGLFYWSSTSTATDDGVNTIKPNSISTGNPGRYLRQTNLFGTSGSFQVTVAGCSTAPTLTCTWTRNGNTITVNFPGTGLLASTATTFGLNGWPTNCRDNLVAVQTALLPAYDNSAAGVAAFVQIEPNTGYSLYPAVFAINNTSGLWTASGSKQVLGCTFVYNCPNGTT